MTNDLIALADRLAQPYLGRGTGAIAVAVAPGELAVRPLGRICANRPDPPGPDTLFEIGSITKVFTALLLARLVLAGRLSLDDPIPAIDPRFAGLPGWITPRTLSTHTSGLPRLQIPLWKLPFLSVRDPYADFSAERLVAWMARWRPRKPPTAGALPSYSNLGVGLLGCVLGETAGGGYEAALRREVTGPLGLTDTTITLSQDQQQRLARPHTSGGEPTPPWTFDALAGAGALRSTANDLAAFARAIMAAVDGDGPLAPAIALTLQPQIAAPHPMMPTQCLGWIRMPVAAASAETAAVYHHDGGTLGSSSSLFVAPNAGRAIAVLANRGLGLRAGIKLARADILGISRDLAARTADGDLNAAAS